MTLKMLLIMYSYEWVVLGVPVSRLHRNLGRSLLATVILWAVNILLSGYLIDIVSL